MPIHDENLITCTNRHTTARKFWRLFDVDPAALCCPICGSLQDGEVLEIAQPDQARAIPPGRIPIHIDSLIAKVEAWQRSREAGGYRGGCLPEVVAYLREYSALLKVVEPDVAVADPIIPRPRQPDPIPVGAIDWRVRGEVADQLAPSEIDPIDIATGAALDRALAPRGIVALFVLACVTMLSGCYAPDLSKVKYRCDVAALCPDGLACVQGWCVDPAVQMGADAGVMTQADMMAVTMPPSCARGVETVLSSRMHGCYGTVAAGEFNDSLCKSGRLCTQNDPAAMDPPMFYLANVLGQQTAPAPVSGQIVAGWGHGAQYNQTTRYLFGRGGGNYVERSPVSVAGFTLVMQCLPTGTSYASCPWNWGDDRDVNRVTATGWLCCNF